VAPTPVRTISLSAIPCVVRQNSVHIWAVCLSRTLVIFRPNNVRRLSQPVSVMQAAISKDVSEKMVRKLETKGTLQTRQGGHRPEVTDNTAPNVRRRFLPSSAKSLACPIRHVKARQGKEGFILTMLLLSRISSLLTVV
jgi:hypothetical protein